MDRNLSIDEIIRQAEEIREKTVKQAKSALEEVNASAQEITGREIEVPKPNVKEIVIERKEEGVKQFTPSQEQKTAVIDSKSLKEASAGKPEDNQKTRLVSINEKTGVVPDVKNIKKSKKTFFDSTSAVEPLYSKKPPEIIEKPATIKSKSRFDKTSDLEEIPTIVAVEELERTKISLTREDVKAHKEKQEEPDEDEQYQFMLDGFEDSTEHVEKIDEEVAEQELLERRRDKVNKFRLFSPEDMEKEKPVKKVIKSEYQNRNQKDSFLSSLEESKKGYVITAIITAVLCGFTGLLTSLDSSSYLPSFLLDSNKFLITLLVLFAVTLVVNGRNIAHGFKLKNGINYDTPISIVSVIVLIHTVLLIVNTDLLLDDGTAYPFAVSFALLMSNLGKVRQLTRIIDNFEFLSTKKDMHTVETIVNKVDAAIISRGLLTGEANLKTSIKTDFPTKFLDIGCSDEPADTIAKRTGMIMLGLNAILFVVISIINSSWHIGLNTAICALCISLPCISLFNTNSALLGVSRQISGKGAMINGFEGASIAGNTNAIVIEAQDLFGPRSCEIHGIRTFNGAKADDVILQTASVITQTKSPLAFVFDDVIIGKQSLMPETDGIVYEDKLGTSAWIYRKKILVGTRELLIHHGVDVLSEEEEKKYTRKGRKILYLAITGKLMAMFVVSYSADPELKKALRHLEKSGMTILVKSSDPFINDESIAELFSLPDGYVRVMSSSNGRAFEKYSDMCVEKSPAYITHKGSALAFISAMNAAENLQETRRILEVLISFGCVMGFGVVTLLAAIGGFSQLGAMSAVVFQAVWCLLMEIVSKIKRLTV